eukprot:270312-Pleurochrysis_carterae.AAC.3
MCVYPCCSAALDADSLHLDNLHACHIYPRYKLSRDSRAAGKTSRGRLKCKSHNRVYSKETRTFYRNFVIGGKCNCCAAAAGFAAGVSFATFSNARGTSIASCNIL